MTLTVYTARVSYGGDDRLDITRKSAGADGISFAPSWDILTPALDGRRVTGAMRDAAGLTRAKNAADSRVAESADEMVRAADILDTSMWGLYRQAFLGEMRESYRTQRPAWDALLARESVTLVCYCTDPARCHRTVLASILAKLGAINEGERHG